MGPLETFWMILGRVYDSLKTDADQILRVYDVDRVDAAYLEYVDGLLGWPTNFDLGEQARRRETLNAVNLFKLKGRPRAVESFIEGVTLWDASVSQGWRRVMFTNDPSCTTPDPSTVSVPAIDTASDELFYTPTQENWKCLNGWGVTLVPVEGLTAELAAISIAKVKRVAPELLLPSWVTLSMMVQMPTDEEEVAAVSAEATWASVLSLATEEVDALAAELYTDTWGAMVSLMVTNTASRLGNVATTRLHHPALAYAGPTPPSPYP